MRMAARRLKLTSATVDLLSPATQAHVNTFYGWAPPDYILQMESFYVSSSAVLCMLGIGNAMIHLHQVNM